MLAPEKVKKEAEKKEDENIRFRIYLKCNAQEKKLDRQFLALHRELFAEYDCSSCRNCCKMYKGLIPPHDIEKCAEHLGMEKTAFVERFLDFSEGKYMTKHMPCDFLDSDGNCILGECRPDSCKKYPHTDQPGRLQSMYSILYSAEVCPVVFEILERLKKEYGFKSKRQL